MIFDIKKFLTEDRIDEAKPHPDVRHFAREAEGKFNDFDEFFQELIETAYDVNDDNLATEAQKIYDKYVKNARRPIVKFLQKLGK